LHGSDPSDPEPGPQQAPGSSSSFHITSAQGRSAELRELAFWAVIVGLLLLSAAVIWYDLTAHEVLGRDENVTIVKLDQPGVKAVLDATNIRFTGQPSNTQPLYFLLQYPFWDLVGRSTFMLRFLPSLFGLLTVVFTYKLGEALLGREVGLIGAFLTALLPLHVQYSQIARPYTMLAALSLASAYFLVRALQTNRIVHWAGFVLAATLNFYNHYNALFVLATEGLFAGVVWLATLGAVLKKPRTPDLRARLMRPVIGFLAAGLLCMPGFIRLFGLPWVEVSGQVESGGSIIIEPTLTFFQGFMYRIGYRETWIQALIVGLMLLGLVGSLYRRRWQAALLAVIWIVMPFAILSVIKSPRPFTERYLIFVPPVALLLVGQGIVFGAEALSALGGRRAASGLRWALILAFSAGLALLMVEPLRTHHAASQAADRLKETVEVVERQARPGDIVIISRRSFIQPLDVNGAEVLYLTEHLSPAELDDLASRYNRTWILYTSFIPPAELQEPLDRWVQAHPDRLIRVPIKAINVLAFGTLSPISTEADLQDRITVLEDLAQNVTGKFERYERHNLLADAYQALSDYYDSQGESSLATEYRDRAEKTRAAAPPP
jgi:hypothetical protein